MKKLNLLIVLIVVIGVSLVAYTVSAISTTPSFEVTDNPFGGPTIINASFTVAPVTIGQNEDVEFSVGVEDISGIASVETLIKSSNGTLVDTTILYDNGVAGGDAIEGDGIYGGVWNSGSLASDTYSISVKMQDRLGNFNTDTAVGTVVVDNTAGAPTGCTSNAECGSNASDKCCNTVCMVDECIDDLECTSGTNGVCNTTSCPSVCEYTSTSDVTPVISSSLTASGEEGNDFHYQIVADNIPTSFNAVGLPVNLDINTTTGIISGILDAGTSGLSPYSVTISATNAATVPTDTQTLVLTVAASADTIPPVVSIISPLDRTIDPNQPFTSDTIIVKALATDETNVQQVEYFIDGSPQSTQLYEYDSLNNPGEYWETLVLPNGVSTLTAVAGDGTNFTTSAPVEVELNMPNSAPVINAFMDVDDAGAQYVGDYDNGDTIRFKSDSSDDGLVIQVEIYKNGGSGPLAENTPAVPASDLSIIFGIGASTITYLDEAMEKYAAETSNFKLPFIPVAKAEIIGNQNCTTTTTTRVRQVYAVVYDDADLSTTSGMVDVTINTTSTNCVNIPPPAGAGA
ncbi:MAG: Ig-like domain-containing protein [Candidatus Kerfeldbacteria bacterium]